MLHQETGVNRNQDCRGEVAQEAQDLTGGIGIFQRCLLRESTGSRVTHGWDDARRGIQHKKSVCEGNEDGGSDRAEDSSDHVEGRMDDGWQQRQGMHESGIRCHEDRGERRKVAGLRRRRERLHGIGWLVVGEYLVNAENHIGEEQRALNRVSAPTANPPGAQYDCASDRDSDQRCIHIGDLRELENAPKEVHRA